MDSKELRALLEEGLGNREVVDDLKDWWELAPGSDNCFPTVAEGSMCESYLLPWSEDYEKEYWEDEGIWIEVYLCGPFVAWQLRQGECVLKSPQTYEEGSPFALADAWAKAFWFKAAMQEDGVYDEIRGITPA